MLPKKAGDAFIEIDFSPNAQESSLFFPSQTAVTVNQ